MILGRQNVSLFRLLFEGIENPIHTIREGHAFYIAAGTDELIEQVIIVVINGTVHINVCSGALSSGEAGRTADIVQKQRQIGLVVEAVIIDIAEVAAIFCSDTLGASD